MHFHILSSIIFAGQFSCLVLSAIYFRDWFKNRHHSESFFIGLCSLSLIGYSTCEIGMMYADNVPDFVRSLYWGHVFAWPSYIAFALFVSSQFKAGHTRLMWAGLGLRTVTLVISIASPFSVNFTEITGLKHVGFFGETLSLPVGTRNPLMLIGHVGTFVLLLYCIDVAAAVYRRGERGPALWFAGTVVFFIGGRFLDTVLVMWGLVDFPITTSPFFMGMVISMAFQLSNVASRVRGLDIELEAKNLEYQSVLNALKMAEDTARVGVWIREVATGKITASEEWREIYGFAADEEINIEKFLERVHPDDKKMVQKNQALIFDEPTLIDQSYRIILPDGRTRWLRSKKNFEMVGDAPAFVYGATADVTRQMEAEDAASRLGGLLIGAMEIERSRLARELHDDLSQQVALLSIKLEMLTKAGETEFGDRVHELSEDLGGISDDIRRMSHTLHPAKLDQLGLAAAVRGFCREFNELHKITVDLRCGELPKDISRNVSLCVYRLTQEALQNIAKHSHAQKADVEIRVRRDSLILKVSDDGVGFERSESQTNGSLGLISMHERVASVNGKLNINSKIGSGTHIRAEFPMEKAIAATDGF
jgi:signal transduction histidine kinase